jgi:hypothetical protein
MGIIPGLGKPKMDGKGNADDCICVKSKCIIF